MVQSDRVAIYLADVQNETSLMYELVEIEVLEQAWLQDRGRQPRKNDY